MLSNTINQFLKPGHQWPYRLVLRSGNDWYRILDLQIKIDSNSLSVFMKPPIDGLFVSKKPSHKLLLPESGSLNIDLSKDIIRGKTFFNPYLSWHSSGVIHANAYSDKKLDKENFIDDSKAVSLLDIGKSVHIILTAILPISILSYFATKAPPPEFDGNYLEISDKPYLQNKFNGVGPLNIVFDRLCLKPSSIVLDVVIHDRRITVDFAKNHPYPNNSEMCFVHPPIQITPDNICLPAITLFFYQPINITTKIIKKEHITLWGRSKGQKEDIIFQVIKI